MITGAAGFRRRSTPRPRRSARPSCSTARARNISARSTAPALSLRVITPVFKEDKDGQAKIVSFHAKRARGAMARYVIERRLTDPDALKEFDAGGYGYRADLSSEDEMVFTRPG